MISITPQSENRTKEPMLTLATLRGSNMAFGIHAKCLNYNEENFISLCDVKIDA